MRIRLAALFLCLICQQARAQCGERWLVGEPPPGLNGEVNAAATWDPDGAGARPELLVMGGSFSVAGSVAATGVATWDGSHWQAIGEGLGNGSSGGVNALAVYNGQIIAAGSFTASGSTALSRI